jgi:hypothetical protein
MCRLPTAEGNDDKNDLIVRSKLSRVIGLASVRVPFMAQSNAVSCRRSG